jgi:poly-gamma-glutamate synthesis protein (capsule biosynthesis protein)
MSGKRALSNSILNRFCNEFLLGVLIVTGIFSSVYAEEPPTKLIFTGDVMLAREVQREITFKHGISPWSEMANYFKDADWLMGNLEGSVGVSTNCIVKGSSPCFAIQPEFLKYLQDAGFTAMGIENNHIADLGTEGRTTTRVAINKLGLATIDFEHSPGYVKINKHIFAFIALSNVPGKDDDKIEIPSNALRQKIRLAKSLADWVIVNVHWGVELADWPQPKQQDLAKWMIVQGADVIIGHHPHVTQSPECILGKPVFFSLGNHIFDQKYEETKRGLIASCTVIANQLHCSAVETITPMNSSFPELSKEDSNYQSPIENCSVPMSTPLIVGGYTIRPRLAEKQYVDGEIVLEGSRQGARKWDVVAKHLLAIEKGHLVSGVDQKEYLFTLEQHHSSIDQEMGPRPYVYDITSHGLVAKWRGSALAWPLIDGKMIRAGDLDYLCALHRKDSFIELDPNTKETRTEVYQWNGFGFSGIDNPNLIAACERTFM